MTTGSEFKKDCQPRTRVEVKAVWKLSETLGVTPLSKRQVQTIARAR